MKNMVNTKWRFPTALIGLLLVIVLVLEACGGSSASSGGSSASSVSIPTQTPAPDPQGRVNAYKDCVSSNHLTGAWLLKYIDGCAKVAGTEL